MKHGTLATSLLLSTLLLLMISSNCAAAGPASILGIWNNEEKDARIEIFRCGGRFCGKIVWIDKPLYSDDEDHERSGMPRTDDKNPNPDLKSRTIIGLQIMSGFEYAGQYSWVGGRIYDPKSGRTYSGKITMVSPDRLELRGYVIFSLFGRTSFWTRANP